MKPRSLTSVRLAAVLAAGVCLLQTAAADAPPLTADGPILIPDSKGKFDFIETDPTTSRLLASHTGNKTLDVFDSVSGALISHCNTGGAQAVAVDTANGKYYVSVGAEKKLVAVDSKTFAKAGETALSGPADLVTYDPKNGLAYACHDDGTEVWAVDVKDSKIVTSITIPEGPEGIVYDRKTDWIFLAIKPASKLIVIDPTSNKIVKTWDTVPATGPHGLALDSDNGRLFIVGGGGKLVMIDIPTGKVTASVDIAPKVDQIAIDLVLKRIYCASGTGILSIVQITDGPNMSLENIGSVPTHKGAHSVAVDAKSHTVWIAYADGEKSYIQKFTAK